MYANLYRLSRFSQLPLKRTGVSMQLLSIGVVLAAIWGTDLAAQVRNPEVRYVATDPTGACSAAYITVNRTTGVITTCRASVWTAAAGGAASGTAGGALAGTYPNPAFALPNAALGPLVLDASVNANLANPSVFYVAPPGGAPTEGSTMGSDGVKSPRFTVGTSAVAGTITAYEGTPAFVPSATTQSLFLDPTTHHLQRKNNSSVIVDIELGGALTSAIIIGKWSGTCDSSHVLMGDGTCAAISSAFSTVTAGTNATALVIGSSGSLTVSGTGTIDATSLNGTALSGLATGILKNTTTTGVPSIAVAADFPTLNQNTTGSAASLSAVLTAGAEPAHTGDMTNSAGSLATTVGAIGGKTVTLANSFTTAGNFALTLTQTATTSVTLPVSGTLVTGGSNITTVGAIPYVSVSGTLQQDQTSGGQFFWDSTNHRLGIGTVSPVSPLQVENAANSAVQIRVRNTFSSGNRIVDFKVAPDTGASGLFGSLSGRMDWDNGSNGVAIVGGGVFIGKTTSGGASCTGTACVIDSTSSTGASKLVVGQDGSGTFTGIHTSATTASVGIVAGQAQSTTQLFHVDNNSGTAQTYIDASYDVTITGQKASTGQRYVCIDTAGKLVSSAAACVGT